MKAEIAKARTDMKDTKAIYESLLKAEEILDVAGKAEVRLEELNKAIDLAGQELEGLRAEAADLKEGAAEAKKDMAADKKKVIEEAKDQAEKIINQAKNDATGIVLKAETELEELTDKVREQRELLKLLQDETAEAIAAKQQADEALAASREAVKNVMGA